MAEAFLRVVLENLSSLIKEEIGLIMGVDKEMKKLFSTFTTIQAVLEDAEEKQLESRAIRDWLCKLNDLVYEIDDIVDECATHVSKQKVKNSQLNLYSLKKILFQHKIGRRMKKVTQKLDAVAAERAKFHLREMAIEKPREVAATRETGSVLSESHQVFGREEDREKIVDILVNHVRENQEISVLPVVGIGGLGKTTLAQLVFNDQQVVDHFERRLWVCVSDNFDLKTLVKAMIESGSGSASDLVHLDTLQHRLWDLLNQKRYLLVLDDVWNEDQEKWFELKNILACGSNGASIIVTTRQKKVADIMGTLSSHFLEGLSEEHCWMLLRQRAFGDEKEEYPSLEVIGKQIVKKCAGVPMAAKALGGVLRFKRNEKEWIYVKESEIWNLPPEETLILPALRLSYHHLPLGLRPCFAYFAVFPKDFTIESEELIFLWMAHGHISSRGILEVEDVGNEICDELLLRSLIQYDLHETRITMHDLVHDLAQSIMENKVPGTQVETHITSASDSKIRQVSLRNKLVAFPSSIQHDMDISSILVKFSRLRVLDASFTTIKDLPSTVGNLKHLRFLNLSQSEIRTLPNSLCSLWNLQILNLDYCERLVALPKNMRYLNNLRHLLLESCESLSGMPPKIGELTCLKTLSLFIVGRSRGNHLEELQCLNLGGELEIQHLERVETYMDAKKANLVEKKDLRQLSLVWESNGVSKIGEDIDEKVLEALQPHPNLEILHIRGFSGRCFPSWMTNSTLEKIVRIVIMDCRNCSRLPQLGELPHLKSLYLANLAVEYIVEDDFPANLQFPSLERLDLISLSHLKGLLKEQVIAQAFPNLVRLRVKDCPLVILTELPSIQELHIENCNSLMLSSISKMDTLTSLGVGTCENMKCIPIETLERLGNLKSLEIGQAEELFLPEDGLRALKSLTELSINRNNTLTCLPERWLRQLTTLKSLYILECPEFVELPEEIKYLKHLEIVDLFRLPKMVCIPKALEYLSSLKSLYMLDLPRLNSLPDWLENLTSLRTLHIGECPKLVTLPPGIQRMANLQSLTVWKCPQLERRCERGIGEDWHKIAHIPHLQIGHYY